MTAISTLLLTAIGLRFVAECWLDRRQIAHVRARRDEVPPHFADRVTPDEHRKAADYTVARVRSKLVTQLLHLVLLCSLIFAGCFAVLQSAVEDIAGTGYLASLALAGAVAFLYALVAAQSDYHEAFSVEARFGFNNTSKGLFVVDLLKSWAIGAVFMVPIVLGIDYTLRTFGAHWWLVGWGLWVAFSLIMIVIAPSLIMPLFNKFERLSDGPLRSRVEALLARCGVELKDIFTMDGSKRSSHGNAFFTGLGPAKRIVLFDTLKERLSDDEIEAVLAHEIGHLKLRHIARRLVMSLGIGLLAFALMGYLSQQTWFYAIFLLDPALATTFPFASVLMFVLVIPTFAYWFRFAGNQLSRRHEFEADHYAATKASAGNLISALVKLHRDNASTLTPDPLYSWVNYSHPTAVQRIARLEPLADQPRKPSATT
ncbi:MAG TPA: M48 family metallopeptidase [Dongiaceae bacterium]|nr:M48 family metallopeptidase [Dongiaceae bacterium]